MNIQEIRQKYPQYNDLSDEDLAGALHRKYYADMPFEEFAGKIGLQAQAAAADPTEGMSSLEKFRAGMGKTMVDTGRGIAQRGIEAINALENYGILPKDERTAQSMREIQASVDEAAKRDAPLMRTAAGKVGAVAGAIPIGIATAPIPGGGTVAGSTAIGAAMGALQPTQTGESVARNALTGAIGGGAGGLIGKGIQVLARGPLSKGVTQESKALMQQGVRLTPGQAIQADKPGIVGKLVRGAEERAKAWPIVGPMIRSSERKAFQDWNRVIAKEVAPDGFVPKTPKDAAIGDVVGEIADEFSNRYQNVLGKHFINLDDQFIDDMARLERKYSQLGTGAGGRGEFDLRMSELLDTLAPNNGFRGDQIKILEGQIREWKQSAFNRGNAPLGEAFEEVGKSLKNMIHRSLPKEARKEIIPLDRQYAKFLRLQDASAMLGAQSQGLVTPRQLLSAVRRMDKTKGKRAFGRTRSLMQDEAQLANDILGNTLPDVGPGTAEKLIGYFGPTAASGTMLYAEPTLGALWMAATSRPGMKYMLGGYPGQEIAGRIAERITPSLASMAAQYALTNK
jgi:hypothetical protein